MIRMSEKTTIELKKRTRNRLADLKDSEKETFDEVIKYLLDIEDKE